jgi:hypothetical protein
VIVQLLTDYIWVELDSVFNEDRIDRVAKVFYALRVNLGRLASYYKELEKTGPLPKDSRYFPSITSFPRGKEEVGV